MPLEDDADHELHAETDERLVLWPLDVDCVGQLDDLLQQASLDQAVQDVLVGDPVQLHELLAFVNSVSWQGCERNLNDEVEESEEGEVGGLLRQDAVLLVLDVNFSHQSWIAERWNLWLGWDGSISILNDLQQSIEVASDREEFCVLELCIHHEDRVLLLENQEWH